jgi:hypothetical protein
MMANVRAERLPKIPAEPSPELRIPNAAAQTRMVSVAKIRLDLRESTRLFKGIICDDISEFESSHPSHAVGLSQVRRSKSGKSGYTKLFACISEEEDGYMVQVRLSDEVKPENSAWGEEIVDSFETASELVAALAGEFSIEQACITIEIRIHNHEHGTRYRPTPAGRVSLWGPLVLLLRHGCEIRTVPNSRDVLAVRHQTW